MIQGGYLKGALLTTAGVLIISPDALLLRLINTDFWTLLFWRSLLCAFGLASIVCFLERPIGVQRLLAFGRPQLLLITINACSAVLFVLAILNTAVANVLVIISISPLLSAILSRVFLREQILKRTWYGLVTVFLSLTVLFLESFEQDSVMGNTAAFGVAVLMSCNFVLLRYHRKVNMIPTRVWSETLIALLAWPLATPTNLDSSSWTYVLILGLAVLPIASALITLGPRYLPAPQVGLIMLLEILLGPLWIWFVIREIPTLTTLIAGVVILITLTWLSVLGIRDNKVT